jgi:hypothetical protein
LPGVRFIGVALVLWSIACAPAAEPANAPDAAAETPPAELCADGQPSPVAALDARAIDALRRRDVAALRSVATDDLDVERALAVGEIPDALPFVGCTARPTGVETRYLGMHGGVHELWLEWRNTTGEWQLASVSTYGW